MRELEFKVSESIEPDRQLHICPDEQCRSELIHLIDWRRIGTYYYRLWIRCPECEHKEEVVSNFADQIIGFNKELRIGIQAVQVALEHMEEDVDGFIGGLAAINTQPEDFLS